MAIPPERWRITINGIVQGVGFRPFVCRLARERGLAGFVGNTPEGVTVEAEGGVDRLADLVQAIRKEPPPLAQIATLAIRSVPLALETTFRVHDSSGLGAAATLISPDVAVCPECLAEFFSPADRRFRYPFLNCTNCGPRYTIVTRIPYDRPHTTMRDFVMCAACKREYDDPENRRFHAQPTCCPDCGPQLRLLAADGRLLAERDEAVVDTLRFLQAGAIVAIKGLGGFHLAVDAENAEAVGRLRQRKGREAKPFAVMVANLGIAGGICLLADEERQALTSRQRPIVLARKRADHFLAEEVAPGQELFGLMLPYTPLHHLLFEGAVRALVMTSANISEEPICVGNEEAGQRLAGTVDYILCHDRDIHLHCDDSLVAMQAGAMRLMRRGRGYAPRPIPLAADGPMLLGVGAELKNTVCLLKGNSAFLSQHIGDLKNLEAYRIFQKSIAHLAAIFEIRPELVVHDLHPGYLSSRWAREQAGLASLAVQHHHAHLAACLAENREEGPAIGIILDGTGYGTDQTIWGGEVLIGNAKGFSRFAALESLPLPGGDAAVQAPWRTALSYLFAARGECLPPLPFLAGHDPAPILGMIRGKINSPLTSSCGRLFDAVAAMGGGRQVIQYEAQAAIELMQAAGNTLGEAAFPCEFFQEDGMVKFSVRALVAAIAEAVTDGMGISEVSRRFHQSLVAGFTYLACQARRREKIRTLVLSGGVFQNRLLLEGLVASLSGKGFRVLTHTTVPCNDACISLGQAVIGRQMIQER
ncbi:carbamoyltransferase HypF [Thiovibrio sp. JS02]